MSRKKIAHLFIAFSIAYSIFTVLRILLTFQLFDFVNVYYPAIQDILHGRNLYGNPATDVNYPPTTFVLLFPFGLAPVELAQKAWTIVSFATLPVSIFLLLRSFQKKVSIYAFLLIYSFSMLAFPIKFTLGMGQVNLIVLFFVALCFFLYRIEKPHLAGIALGVACALKLTPLFFLLFFVRKGAFKLVLSTLATLGLAVLFAGFLFGEYLLRQYFFEVFPNIPTVGNNVYYNQALTGFLARAGIPDEVAKIANYTVFAVLLLIGFILTASKKQDQLRELSQYGLFITAVLIGAGLAWQHHFVLLIIPYIAVFFSIIQIHKKGILLYALLTFLSYSLVAFNIKNPQGFSGFATIFLSHVLYGTLLLYVLLSHVTRSYPDKQ